MRRSATFAGMTIRSFGNTMNLVLRPQNYSELAQAGYSYIFDLAGLRQMQELYSMMMQYMLTSGYEID
jgi:hypothetical protein